MKLHKSVVDKIVRLYELYGGRKENKTLSEEIKKLDLSVYTQQEQGNASFLVLTEDVIKAKNGIK